MVGKPLGEDLEAHKMTLELPLMENQKIVFPSMKRGIMIEMTLRDRKLVEDEKGTEEREVEYLRVY